jgi:hypothetical protein
MTDGDGNTTTVVRIGQRHNNNGGERYKGKRREEL